MRSVLADVRPEDARLVIRKLRLIWKDPETSRYYPIGQFEALSDGRYAFGYLPEAFDLPGFSPLVQFPDPERIYVFEALPAFLSNRVISRHRPDYDAYVGWLGLAAGAPPMEILARTGGGRVTDTFHVVDAFEESGGRCEGRFFISGIRHRNPAAIDELTPGQELLLKDEPDNSANPQAILLTADGKEVGWVPDWLVSTVHGLRSKAEIRVRVEQVNRAAPLRLAVLCHLTATRPAGADGG